MIFDNIKLANKAIQNGNVCVLIDDKNTGYFVIAAEKATSQNIAWLKKVSFNQKVDVVIDDKPYKDLREAQYNNIFSQEQISYFSAPESGFNNKTNYLEGIFYLLKLTKLKPAAVICKILNNNHLTANLDDLQRITSENNIPIFTIQDLLKYRLRYDSSLIQRTETAILPTQYGLFNVVAYDDNSTGMTHLALRLGKIDAESPILTRVHSECLTGDVFGSRRCDCGLQLKEALNKIAAIKNGVFLYLRQEGRGIGLSNKVRAYALQDKGMDTVDANLAIGCPIDAREYGIAAQILEDLGVGKINLLTNNPEKMAAFNDGNLKVIERVPLEISSYDGNHFYLKTKKERMGHLLDQVFI